MHLGLVGPVAPFRGGIGQHTTRLAEALSRAASLDVVSFSRLYPPWLYPGAFQTEPTELSLAHDATVRFTLDAVNPITWWTSVRHLVRRRPSAVVMPWWTAFLAPCFYVLARRLRASGVPVLFVVHNVLDHEPGRRRRELTRAVLGQGRWFVTHANAERQRLIDLLGPVAAFYEPQPAFDRLPDADRALPRRADLELLFFGFIRPYKGLDILLEALRRLAGEVDFHLTIAGEPWGESEGVWRQRIAAAGLADRIELVARYVDAGEAAACFERADAVVLPYRHATGAAVVPAAYRYRKPVLAARVGSLADTVEDGVTGLLFPPEDPAALAAAIRRFARERLPRAHEAIDRLAAETTWDRLALRIVDLIAREGAAVR